MSIFVTQAETFKRYFPFINDWDRKKNISYHLQYIEFLYKARKIHEPRSTTLSLLIKTIVIEYFTVIEAVIDALLCQLKVQTPDNLLAPIDIDEYTRAERLLKLAKKYRIIDTTIHSKLGIIKNTRNKIHIKRPRRNQALEYRCYTTDLLGEHEKIYKDFFCYLFEKNSVDKNGFPWPWDAIP